MLNKLYLDLNNFKPNLGSIERGDSIELNIKLLDSEDYSRSKFRVLGTKGDGKYVEQIESINLEGKDLKVILEDQFVNCEGIVKLELNVVSGETEITTKEFYFFVSNTMNASIIDSADSLPTLEKVSKYVDDAVDNLEALKGASEDITIINSEFKENEIKRKANEMLREKNEKARLQSEDIRITEEKEREANELERIQAENDRKVSESNRKLAENTRKTNEAARVEAELNRQSLFEENEEIRNSNENLRIAYEKERIKFNSEAKTDELNRKEAEKNRVLAEEERKSSEESRVAAEAIRQNTYTDFNDSEVERKNNEIKREEAEALRVEAETRRDNLFSEKEEERNTSFIESEKVRNAAFNKAQDSRNTTFEESETIREEAFKISEKARNDAEELRVTAESERVKAEKLRVDSEKARVLAEEERNTTFTQKEEERNNTFTQNETNRNNTFTQSEEERKTTFEEAENARKVAESKRVKTESSRVETEKLRLIAETGRVEAENLRVTAEEKRVAAETKREEGFNKFDGKINANTKELKNARSATTGEKFNSLDERIDHEVDRLNKKIDVTMLQQEDKESHTIENAVDGMTTDMVIKGRTLNNLIKNGKADMVIDKSISPDNRIYRMKTSYPLTAGNTYIGYINITKFEGDSTYGLRIYGMPKDEANGYYTIAMKTGWHKFIWKTQSTTKNFDEIGIYMDSGDYEKNCKITFNSFMLFEQNSESEKIFLTEYFEGLKSFGQQEDKISILSSGKNLLNFKSFENYIKNTHENEVLYSIKLKPNTNYTFSDKTGEWNGKGAFLIFKDKDKKEVSRLIDSNVGNRKSISFTTNNNTNYYLFTYKNNIDKFNSISSNYQIEEGSQATFYEPYQSYKKDILLQNLGFDEGLRGLNNSVYDELNDIKNVAIKKIEKKIINNNDNIIFEGNLNSLYKYYLTIQNLKPSSIISDYPVATNHNDWINATKKCILVSDRISSKSNRIYIVSDLPLEEFKASLNLNPISLYYELAEPVETPLTDTINVKSFNERTYVSFENAISGTSSFKAPVNTKATISRLNRENRALEEENRSLRQDFESTTLSLTDSDLELVKQNVDMDFRLMEVEFALDIPQSTLSSNINFKKER